MTTSEVASHRPGSRACRCLGVLALSAALSVALAGCGTSVVDRTLSGGLIGAGGGAAVGAAVGNPAAGAVIGGVAGAVTGAVTSGGNGPNLGKPIWR